MASKGFFIVYSPEGEAPPRVQHKNHGAAMHQAARLAKANPGRRFFVMRTASRPLMVEPDAADGQHEADEVRRERLAADMAGEAL